MRRVAVTLVVMLACTAGVRPAPDAPRVEVEVLAFLEAWNRAVADRDTSAVRPFYAEGTGMRWYEDGVLRYVTREQVVDALAGFPSRTIVSTTLERINVVVITDDQAHIEAAFRTRIQMSTDTFAFAGVFTSLLHRGPTGWQFVSGHTSTVRAEAR